MKESIAKCARVEDMEMNVNNEVKFDEEVDEDDAFSDISDITSQTEGGTSTYSLDEINMFLDDTYGKTAEVSDFFPDENKFISSVLKLQKNVGFDELNQQKRFRLKKILTKLRRGKRPMLRKRK